MYNITSLPLRFQTKIEIQPDGCWLWVAARSKRGYGNTTVSPGKYSTAHRAVYKLLAGNIPEGLTLDHLCRNIACVNPEHLEPVTLRENLLRGFGIPAVNARKTHCIRGHAFTDENTFRKRQGTARECMQCRRDAARRWYHANKSRARIQ